MKTKMKNVFYCSTCNKKGLVKWRIEQHEKFCLGNPDNVPSCFKDCKHLKSVSNETNEEYYEEGGEIHTREVRVPHYFYCKKVDSQLHTKKSEITARCKKYPEHYENSIQMPSQCSHYEEKDLNDLFDGF